MAANAQGAAHRNRLDHVLPQGYLDGFTSPSQKGQVSVFDRQEGRWFETGTRGVGAIRGYYDYSEGSHPDQTADQAFTHLETEFPTVRRELIENNFSNWRAHLDFLLSFAHMLSARTELFREQDLAHARTLTMFKIAEVVEKRPSKVEPGKFDMAVKVRPSVSDDEKGLETLLRNKTITDMRTEIAKGASWASKLHWCLQFALDPADPVITADNPIVINGSAPTLEKALLDDQTLFFFPVCSQACLIGSTAKFDKEIDAFHPSDLRKLRVIYLGSARRFIFSPVRTEFS